MLSHVQFFATAWTIAPPVLLCPWDFSGKNTGAGYHFLLQGIFPTHGSNPGLPHCKSIPYYLSHQFSSVQSLSCVSLQPHRLQHARIPCPSPTLGDCSNSCPSSQWCHPTVSSSVVPFSPHHLRSFPASGPFPVSQFFTSGGQSIGVSASASVLPMNS